MSDFWNSILIKKSRVMHRCEFCEVKIEIGQPYSHECGMFNGEFNDYALCVRCRTLLDSYDPVWEVDGGELGTFHEAFAYSKFVKCPICGCSRPEFEYAENMMSVKLTCDDCGTEYTVNLSSDNLLKRASE